MGRRVIKLTEVVGPVSIDSNDLNMTEVNHMVKKQVCLHLCCSFMHVFSRYHPVFLKFNPGSKYLFILHVYVLDAYRPH